MVNVLRKHGRGKDVEFVTGAGFAPTVLPMTAAVPVAAEPVDPTMEVSTDGMGKMMKHVGCLVSIWEEHVICLLKEL